MKTYDKLIDFKIDTIKAWKELPKKDKLIIINFINSEDLSLYKDKINIFRSDDLGIITFFKFNKYNRISKRYDIDIQYLTIIRRKEKLNILNDILTY